jgi:uncharacterized membrane protein YadS
MATASLTEDRRASTLYETEEWISLEDWLTVLAGFFCVVFVLYLHFAGSSLAMPAFRWTTERAFTATVEASRAPLAALAKDAEVSGEARLARAVAVVAAASATRDRAAIGAAAKGLQEAAGHTEDRQLAKRAGKLATPLVQGAGAVVGRVFSLENLRRAVVVGGGVLVVAAVCVALIGGSVARFLLGFPIVYALAWVAQIVAGNMTVHYWGLEYVVFALVIGLVVSNVVGTPAWLLEAVRTEFYIRTGLVILGAGLLFLEIVAAGAVGIVQAVLVVTATWFVCLWLARRLRVEDGFAAMLCTAVSVCGVSAAIAAYGAVRGDRRKLSYVTSLVLVVAVPMMILEPWAAKLLGFPDLVAGAWLGGTLDTSASVVAAGALISESALKVGTIVKFSQNVLIGVIAFLLALWWVMRSGAGTGERPSVALVWQRFPKFVLGFLVASATFSFLLDADTVRETKSTLAGLRTVWFALAFTCIGLETRFTDLIRMDGGRPAVAFIGAQAFNILWALLMAFLLFGGVLFAAPRLG